MSKFGTCPDCGASLDPGERCDCREEQKEKCPAADVVEVVRCKDCRYMYEIGWCSLHDTPMDCTDFCSYGEPREEK